jgi:hypothetical protein
MLTPETIEGIFMKGFWGLRAWAMDEDVFKFHMKRKTGFVIDRTGPKMDGLLPSYQMVERALGIAE